MRLVIDNVVVTSLEGTGHNAGVLRLEYPGEVEKSAPIIKFQNSDLTKVNEQWALHKRYLETIINDEECFVKIPGRSIPVKKEVVRMFKTLCAEQVTRCELYSCAIAKVIFKMIEMVMSGRDKVAEVTESEVDDFFTFKLTKSIIEYVNEMI